MNAAQQLALANALANALEQAGITVERAAFARGNVRGWERVDNLVVAARTIGLWLSWGWVAQETGAPPPPLVAPTSTDPNQRGLRLVSRERVNNDDEDDGS